MKVLLESYKISKYHKLINGVIFALLAIPFFVWGILIILRGNHTCLELMYPFVGMLICLISGLRSLFARKKLQRM